MSAATSIEWTDGTWNPARGCSRVSEGCRHCYAERHAARFSDEGLPFHGFAERVEWYDPMDGERVKHASRWTGRVELVESKLREPLSWRKPRRVFVNSMSDLFHEALPDEAIRAVFDAMADCVIRGREQRHAGHVFQVLTKRAHRMREWFQSQAARECQEAALDLGLAFDGEPIPWPLPNVWLGVSVEDQASADARIPELLQTPAAVRFVSAEPLLEAVDIGLSGRCVQCRGRMFASVPPHAVCVREGCVARGSRTANASYKLPDWIIAGGESGPAARPCDVGWIRSIVEQCRAANVACFVKQLGARPYLMPYGGSGRKYTSEEMADPQGQAIEELGKVLGAMREYRLRDTKGGEPSEWPEDLRVREFPR